MEIYYWHPKVTEKKNKSLILDIQTVQLQQMSVNIYDDYPEPTEGKDTASGCALLFET